MSLRTKLVVSLTVLLLVVITSVGLVASRSIETILVDQIDRVLLGFVERGPGSGFGEGLPTPEEDETLRRETAEILVDPDTGRAVARPSGFVDDPDPLPDISNLPVTDEPFDLVSIDGELSYRAIVQDVPGGLKVVRAIPLTDVDNATDAMIRTLFLAGAGVLLVGGAATWWTVDRSMRPVERMVDTAEAIAEGDLARRITDYDPGTELGRLAASLNVMLGNIEEAVEGEREGQERMRQFVADASHELRTPTTAISGYAELRRKGGLRTPEEEDNAWARIESESRRMGTLIEDLIVLARLGQTQPLDIADVDISRVAQAAATDHLAIDPTRPVRVEGPENLVVRGDTERLHQVVSSLLANVRVHTPGGTLVTIETREADDHVELLVSDDGPGIPEAALEHIFDRFYRADPSRSRRSGGSGLGLAIVRAIVEAHRGTVTASNQPGGGAIFTVILPKAAT